ncbi:hypothetical protein ACLB2K_056031 [Fragaria x ananassa]
MAGTGIHPYHQQWALAAAPPPPLAIAATILNSERLIGFCRLIIELYIKPEKLQEKGNGREMIGEGKGYD